MLSWRTKSSSGGQYDFAISVWVIRYRSRAPAVGLIAVKIRIRFRIMLSWRTKAHQVGQYPPFRWGSIPLSCRRSGRSLHDTRRCQCKNPLSKDRPVSPAPFIPRTGSGVDRPAT
jgi:hypothetical protein